MHVFGFLRELDGQRLLVLANFSEMAQGVAQDVVRSIMVQDDVRDVLNDRKASYADGVLTLQPYEVVWLQA